MTQQLITLKGVAKRYGNIVALQGIDAAITGRIIGLLGPNGAGKSTLLKCLLGLLGHQGDARVLGLSSMQDGPAIRDRVGYMPESDAFLSGMSAVELCTYAAELSGLPRSEAMQRAHAALYYAGLEDKRYQAIEGYSTGMKQRVKLAQALVHDPELLFLDEPTNGLDPRSRDEMLELIVELPERRGCAIVLSTHLLPDVEQVCDARGDHAQGHGSGSSARDRRAARHRRPRHRATWSRSRSTPPAWSRCSASAARSQGEVPTVQLMVDLPRRHDHATLVFRHARDSGLQVRGLGVRRESVEAAFLRVIGAAEPDVTTAATADATAEAPAS